MTVAVQRALALAARLQSVALPGIVYVAVGEDSIAYAKKAYTAGIYDAIVLYVDTPAGVLISRHSDNEALTKIVDAAIMVGHATIDITPDEATALAMPMAEA